MQTRREATVYSKNKWSLQGLGGGYFSFSRAGIEVTQKILKNGQSSNLPAISMGFVSPGKTGTQIF